MRILRQAYNFRVYGIYLTDTSITDHIWINLRNKISKSQEKTEELLKEIAALRKRLENSPEVVDEIKEPEPEILKEPEVFRTT